MNNYSDNYFNELNSYLTNPNSTLENGLEGQFNALLAYYTVLNQYEQAKKKHDDLVAQKHTNGGKYSATDKNNRSPGAINEREDLRKNIPSADNISQAKTKQDELKAKVDAHEDKAHETKTLANDWLTTQLRSETVSLDTVDTLINERLPLLAKIPSDDADAKAKKQAYGAQLTVLKEAKASKTMIAAGAPATAAPDKFAHGDELTKEFEEYKRRQAEYAKAKREYLASEKSYAASRITNSSASLAVNKKNFENASTAFKEAEHAKLEADEWLSTRFKNIEYGDIIKEGQNELGIAKDETRHKELSKELKIAEEAVEKDETDTSKAEYRDKLKSTLNERLKNEWINYYQNLLAYFFLNLGYLLKLKKDQPIRPLQPTEKANFTFRDKVSIASSVLLNLDYALLCFISVFVSIQGLGWPVYSSLGFAVLGGLVTMGINLWGFRNNILSLLKKSIEQIPAKKNDGTADTYHLWNLYQFGIVPVGGIAALVTTSLAASTVAGAFDVTDYWASTGLVLTFGITFVALWGLLTQEPRKWFEGDDPEHPQRNDEKVMERISNSLKQTFGIIPDPDLVDLTQETKDTYHGKRAAARLAVWVAITAVTSYATVMLAPRAAELLLKNGLESFLSHAGWGELGGHSTILPILQASFIGLTVLYNAATAMKLSNFFTRAWCDLPLAGDDGKKHGFFYKFLHPIFAAWNALNNGAFNGAQLQIANEGADTPSGDPDAGQGHQGLTTRETTEGAVATGSATFRSLMFFAATRASQTAKEMDVLEPKLAIKSHRAGGQ